MSSSQWIFDATEQDLPRLVELSRQQPVLVDFWADWCQPCLQLAPVLERVITTLQGKVVLFKVNADTQQSLAAQFGVRSLPTLKLLFQGQLVDELTGLQSEAALMAWLQPHVDPDAAEAEQIGDFLEQAKVAIDAGQGEQVVPALRQLLQDRPEAHAARALLFDLLLSLGQQDEARTLLAEVVDEVEALAPCHARLRLMDDLDPAILAEPLDVLKQAASQPDAEPENLYRFALRTAVDGHFREGLDALILLLRDHRQYKDGLAQKTILQLLECLPKGSPLASEYRRRMFNYLY